MVYQSKNKKADFVRLKSWFGINADRLIAIAIFAVTACSAIQFALAHYGISPLDEGVHFDYIYKITQGDISPQPGSRLSSETIHEVMCRPSIVYPESDCSRIVQTENMPVGGVNYVLGYAGIYYVPAALITTIAHSTGIVSWFMAARIASALLFGLGAFTLYLVSRRYNISRAVSTGMVLTLASCSMLLTQGGTVNPDSLALFAGAMAALVPTLKLSWRNKMIVAILVGSMIALMKPNFVPLGCLAILVTGILPKDDLRPFSLRKIVLNKKFLISVLLATIPLLMQIIWNSIANSRLDPGMRADGYLNDMLYYDGPLISLIFRFAAESLNPLTSGLLPSSALGFLGSIAATTIIGGSIMISVNSNFNNSPRIKTLAISGLLGLLITIVYIPLVLYIAYHSEGASSRYVIPLYAFLAIPVAATMNGRVSRWIPLISGCIGVITVIVNILQ